MEADCGVRRRSRRPDLCPSQCLPARNHGDHARLASAQAGQSRPRSARRRPSPLSARRERDDRGLAQQAARRRARDAAQGSHPLHRSHAEPCRAHRVGEDPRGSGLRKGLRGPTQAVRAGEQHIWADRRPHPRCEPQRRQRRRAQGHRCRAHPAHGLGHPGVDRDHPPPRRRLRHDRAQHPAPGPQPRARAGSRHQRRGAPEAADRRDRQARIQDGRRRRQCAAGGGKQAGPRRRRAALLEGRPAAALCDQEAGSGERREPGRRPAWLRSAHQRADRDLPLRRHRRQALRQSDAGERRPALRHHP